MHDTESKIMYGAALAALAVIATVALVATSAIVAIESDLALSEPERGDWVSVAPFEGTPVERTKALSVDATANVEVRYSATMRHLLARCVNTSSGVALYIVESTATNTTDGEGPYCDTCAGGATLPPLGTAYLRTSAGTAAVRCGFVEDWPTAGVSFTAPGAGGMSSTTADASYLRLDATNDPVTGNLDLAANVTLGDAAADTVTSNAATWTLANDTNLTLTGGVNGLSIDGTTFSVDGAGNRVGIGTAAPENQLDVAQDANSGSQMYIRNPNAGNVAAAALYFLTENPPFSGGLYAAGRLQGPGYSTDQNQLPNQFAFFSQAGVTNGMMFRTDAANAPIVFGVSTSANTGHQTQAEKIRIGSTAVTFNGGNSDVDVVIDSDTEEAAFLVDGQTTANLELQPDGDVVATTGAAPADVSMTCADDFLVSHGDAVLFSSSGTPTFGVTAGGNVFFGSQIGGGVLGNSPNVAEAGWNVMANTATDPPAGDCDAAGEMGRYRWQSVSQRLFVCDGTDGWRAIASAAP